MIAELQSARLMMISTLASSEVDATEKLATSCGFHLDLAEELTRQFAHAWVARSQADSGIEAFLLTWQAADALDIIAIGTAPESRRRGLARALLMALLQFARAHQVSRVLLEVRTSNVAAINLYQSFGFIVGRTRTHYYSNPTEDGVEMLLELGDEASATNRHATRRSEA